MRDSKQCRERWAHYVNPSVRTSKWTIEETQKMFDIISQRGCQWKEVSEQMNGRSYNLIKNRFFASIRKGLRKACKAVNLNKSSKFINEMKPSAISEFFFKEVAFQNPEDVPMPFSSPVPVKDVINYFAGRPHKNIGAQLSKLMHDIVLNCILELQEIKLTYQHPLRGQK